MHVTNRFENKRAGSLPFVLLGILGALILKAAACSPNLAKNTPQLIFLGWIDFTLSLAR